VHGWTIIFRRKVEIMEISIHAWFITKRIVLSALAVAAVAMVFVASSAAQLQPQFGQVNPGSQIKYFGFSAVDVGLVDPNTPVSTPYYTTVPSGTSQYVSEVGGFSNLNHLWVYDPSVSIVTRLNQFQAAGTQAMVDVKDIFLTCSAGSGGSGSGTICTLRSDWTTRWNTFLSTNTGANLAVVGAIYIADEPAWNNVSPSDLATIATTVKASFPSTPVTYVEAYQMVDPSNPTGNNMVVIPTNVDWVGFDHYGTADPSTNSQYLSELAVLKSKMTGVQKLIIVFESDYYNPYYLNNGVSQSAMKTVFDNYIKLANTLPNCVAMLGFAWPGGASPMPGNQDLGGRDLPVTVQAEYVRVGKLIAHK
jgi:hypothetical protein